MGWAVSDEIINEIENIAPFDLHIMAGDISYGEWWCHDRHSHRSEGVRSAHRAEARASAPQPRGVSTRLPVACLRSLAWSGRVVWWSAASIDPPNNEVEWTWDAYNIQIEPVRC